MPMLELTPERHELLLQTVEEALGIAVKVLEDLLDGDKLVGNKEEMLELFDTQEDRVHGLRELYDELRKG